MNYCEDCKSLLILNVCTNQKCGVRKETKWIVEGVELEFKKPLTYAEACIKGKERALTKLAEKLMLESKTTEINAYKSDHHRSRQI